VAYTDLIKYEDLRQADDSRAVVDSLDTLREEAEAVIADVTALIDAELGLGATGRGTIVRQRLQGIAGHEWTYSTIAEDYLAYADQRPVVEMNLQSDDLSDVEIPRQTSRKLQIGSPDAGTVTYFGGYRRPDQVLSSAGPGESLLPTGNGEALDGLTTLPPVLPRQVRNVAINVTLHVLQNRAEGNLGRRVQQTYGQGQVTIEGADPQYIQRQMARLQSAEHRHLVL